MKTKLHKNKRKRSWHAAYDFLRLVLLVIALSVVDTIDAQVNEPSYVVKATEVQTANETTSKIVTEELEDGSLSAVVTIIGNAGQLSDIITDKLRPQIKKLTIIGRINGDDLLLIRQMCCSKTYDEERQGVTHPFFGQLNFLDLTEADIVSGGYYSSVGYGSTYSDEIRDYMFRYSILEKIYLPKTITWIGQTAFEKCSYLLEIHFTGPKVPEWYTPYDIYVDVYVPGDCMEQYMEKYQSFINEHIAIYADPEIGIVNESVNVETAGTLFKELTNPEKTYKLKVSGKLNSNDMRVLSDMIINNILTSLDLAEVTLVDNIGQTIDVLMLYSGFRKLDYFVLPNSIKDIESGAMSNISDMGKFVVTEDNPNYKYVDDVLYTADGKKLVYFNSNIRRDILDILEGTEEIGAYALQGCYVDLINCPSTLKRIDDYGLYNCRAVTINLNSGLLTLGRSCFQTMYNLRNIKLPEGIQVIPDRTFRNCSNLYKVELPSSIISIATNAFESCSNLKSFEIATTTVPTLESNSFNNLSLDNVTLYVATGMKEKFSEADNWSSFANIVEGNAPSMGISKDELAILKTLYEKTGGNEWNTKWNVDWNNDVFVLPNARIETKEDGMSHVTVLHLGSNNLTGELPAELFDLPYLTYLDLYNNNLTGDIGKMFADREPKSTMLGYINLNSNHLSGDVYPFVAALPGLKTLYLNENRLTDISQPLPESLSYFYAYSQFEACFEEALIIDDIALSAMKRSSFAQHIGTYNHGTHSFGNCNYASTTFMKDGNSYYSTLFNVNDDGLSFNYYSSEVPFLQGDHVRLYLQSNGTGSYYRLKLDFKLGDTNLDGIIDLEDLQATVNKVCGKSVSDFFFGAADSYTDGVLNVQDIVQTANITLETSVDIASKAKSRSESIETNNFLVVCNDHIGLELADSISAIDIILSGVNEEDVVSLLPSSDWQMMKKQTDNGTRVIMFSPNGATFDLGTNDIMSIAKGEARVTPVMAVSPSAQPVTLGTRYSTTDISSVSTENNSFDIYDSQGRLVRSNAVTTKGLCPGTYILHDKANGKKQKLNITK